MIKAFRGVIPVLPLILLAFSSTPDSKIDETYFYNLRFLKNSGPPREMKIIRLDSMAGSMPLAERGMLVTYKNRYAKSVKIAGDFSSWKGVIMDRGKYCVWYFFLSGYHQLKDIRYKFLVDGIWIMDSMNPWKEDDGSGSYVSVVQNIQMSEGKHISYRFVNHNTVEFRLYMPEARLITVVGDFNNWNPENDLLEKGRDGIWRLKKRLSRGAYRYKFIIDGKWVVDLYNDNTASDDVGGVCSVLRVE